uniref:Curli production assembly/transport component CsgG n=1 Tax=Candidatus Kentrum sp. DK TaxID=2126562 RepID=A0A450TN63_9GAMM|nr:MAG: Curli production assembly/transport component CsgG [Candidatus Kentron sp. DK]
MIKKIIITALLILLSGGCARDLNYIRNQDAQNAPNRDKIAELRSIQIKKGDTFFTPSLLCLNEIYSAGNADITFSVDRVFDKTGKVYPTTSTALSDLILHALSKISQLKIVETPLADTVTESRSNITSDIFRTYQQIKEKPAETLASVRALPVGVIYPSDYYITGALVQYDETSENPEGNRSLAVDIDDFSASNSLTSASIGIQLRLIESSTGKVTKGGGESASIILQNRFLSSQTGFNFFRLINTDDYGLDYSVTVEDPGAFFSWGRRAHQGRMNRIAG